MTKSVSWSIKFDITVDGEDTEFENLSESAQEYICGLIKNGFYSGMFDDEEGTDGWKDEDEGEYLIYEVETHYKSGITRSEMITAKTDDAMWAIYDKRHRNKDIIKDSAIIDVNYQ